MNLKERYMQFFNVDNTQSGVKSRKMCARVVSNEQGLLGSCVSIIGDGWADGWMGGWVDAIDRSG